MKKYLFLFLTSCLLAASCEKTDDDISDEIDPLVTDFIDCSERFMRCKVNGVDWSTHPVPASNVGDPINYNPPGCNIDFKYDASLGAISLRGGGGESGVISIGEASIETGVNEIIISPEFDSPQYESPYNRFKILDTLFNNILTIDTIDLDKKNLKGTFQFSVVNTSSDTINITEGYFIGTYQGF